MLKEALQYLIGLGDEPVTEVGGVPHWTSNGSPIFRPMPGALQLTTLQGLVDYLKHVPGEASIATCYAVVDGPTDVHLFGDAFNAFPGGLLADQTTRRTYARVSLETDKHAFTFGQWYDLESFLIKLQAQFEDSLERARAIQILGNLKSVQERTDKDDGMTQVATVKAGIALSTEAPITNPFHLAPFRTFREVEQPRSPFILRVREDRNVGKQAALFEADGGAWRLEAAANIKEWLEEHVEGLRVIG